MNRRFLMIQKDHFAGLDTDPLAEAFDNAAAGAAPAAAKPLPENYKPKEHFEKCGKCAGTGMTRWGVCFRCKGKRGKAYKTSPEQRAQARDKKHAREADKATSNLESFKTEHPDVWAWMDGSTFPFAISLRDAVAKYGALSEKQLAAARNALTKLNAAKAARAERAANAPTVEISAISEAFERATAAGIKRPRLTIAGYTFSKAPATGTNAGAIYVRAGHEYIGKVAGGRFIAVFACKPEQEAKVLEIAADPKAAAIAHGRQFGVCAVCKRELSDPVSIANGIGPVCATRMGW